MAAPQDMEGTVALITGGAGGIGTETARALIGRGATLVLVDIDGDALTAMHRDRLGGSSRVHTTAVDFRDPEAAQRTVDSVANTHGRLDALVNIAGGTFDQPPHTGLADVSLSDWDACLLLNLTAPFLWCRAVIDVMAERRHGRIVNITSGAGRHPSRVPRGRIPYAAAKAGLIGFTRQVAQDVAPLGITVNAVAPGLIASAPRLESSWQRIGEPARRRTLDRIPAGRRGTPGEVAAAITFLLSPSASYITGHTLDVNGGRFMS